MFHERWRTWDQIQDKSGQSRHWPLSTRVRHPRQPFNPRVHALTIATNGIDVDMHVGEEQCDTLQHS